MAGRTKFILVCVAIAGLAAVLPACRTQTGDYGGKHPDYQKALAGSPKVLAGLHAQANQLLIGGPPVFEQRIAELQGYPVVVNKWASWCGPCRAEFPYLQRQAAKRGKRIAFFGVDSDDSPASARQFLTEFPVPYPSFSDPDQKIAKLFKATLGFPSTGYYDRKGKLAYTHTGGYASEDQLAADIARYAR
jgi:cytochrome c biogenesis protein CcmG, thiol:disulfide interchange protein DsbE